MISIVAQCNGNTLTMHRNKIAYDKHSCAMHWDCIAYDKHSSASNAMGLHCL